MVARRPTLKQALTVAASMGAHPATRVCERANVASLVLVAPMSPAPGETPGKGWTATGQVDAERELAIREGRNPDAPFDPVTMFLSLRRLDIDPEPRRARTNEGRVPRRRPE